MKDRRCLECGTVIKGRIDKKFCDDACRNNYNNKHGSSKSELFQRVNRSLMRNRRILEQLLDSDDKMRVHEGTLSSQGFNFNYLTHIVETPHGSRYYFCYEYGYMPLDEEWFVLVKRSA
jgi:hypothetical protein